MTSRWYAVQIQPTLLSTAKWNLERQDFEPFFPTVVWRVSKTETKEEPLFKGYGFVYFDISESRWRSVNGTKGVIKMLPKHSEVPTPIRVGFVEVLREQDPIEMDRFKHIIITVGGLVDVTHGLAEGRRGVVDKIRGRFAEIIFPSISGDSNPLTIPTSALMPVDSSD
jgi:transcription antitermination factor NusG